MKLEKTLYKTRDEYGDIYVSEKNHIRSLYFGKNKKQSSVFLLDPAVLILRYTQAMTTALTFTNKPKRILIVGLGGGSLIHFLSRFYPDCNIEVVELRERVIDIAQQYFSLTSVKSNLSVTCENAESYVERLANGRLTKLFDIIFIDAFDQWGPAEINLNMQFILNCQSLLSNQGVLSFNLWNRKEDCYPLVYRKILSLLDGNLLELCLEKRDGNVVLFGFRDVYHIKNLRVAEERSEELTLDYGVEYPKYLKAIRAQNFSIMRKISKHLAFNF